MVARKSGDVFRPPTALRLPNRGKSAAERSIQNSDHAPILLAKRLTMVALTGTVGPTGTARPTATVAPIATVAWTEIVIPAEMFKTGKVSHHPNPRSVSLAPTRLATVEL